MGHINIEEIMHRESQLSSY